MNNITIEERGAAFIREWYRLIDSKAPFETLEKLVDRDKLTVDFPGNQMNFEGFRNWYAAQSLGYTSCHHIHHIQVRQEAGQLKIFAEITWQATSCEGIPITLYPNVTVCLSCETGRVIYYGCVDRVPVAAM
mgnify:CR=1 FL=1